MKSIVTKCRQVQQTSVFRENRHESFLSFRDNLEYIRSSVPVRDYHSILSLLFFSLYRADGLSRLFPSSCNMSRKIKAAILFLNLNL